MSYSYFCNSIEQIVRNSFNYLRNHFRFFGSAEPLEQAENNSQQFCKCSYIQIFQSSGNDVSLCPRLIGATRGVQKGLYFKPLSLKLATHLSLNKLLLNERKLSQ